MTLEQVQQLLTENLPDITLSSQPVTDWKGPFTLPSTVLDYYARVGPAELEIWAYGNPWYVPSLAQLWSLQAGYWYDPITSEPLEGWNGNWLVVASDGGDPYILDIPTGTILHDFHGQGNWNPKPLFRDLSEMISVFAVLGGISARAGNDLTDDESGIRPKYYREAQFSLGSIVGDDERTIAVLEGLGWQ